MKRIATAFLLLAALSARAQTPDPSTDHGAAGLRSALLTLQTNASFLQVTAHPDDEDGGLLTLLSRGRGVRTGLVTLTRGEGGQNKIGPELFDELGATRTEELLASDRYYGVRQFFTRAIDYGYSKTLAEALQKWQFNVTDGGPVVADLVRAIRTFRPDVLVARFGGTDRDGHAHHQASAVMARKAFEEAGDPTRFAEQLRAPENLTIWKPKKLYIGIVRKEEDWTVVEDVGAFDPLLGESYGQLAWEGLSHQRTQGVGQVRPDAGSRPVYYKRIDGTTFEKVLDAAGAVVPPYKPGPAAAQEKGFFDGIDVRIESLDPELAGVARDAAEALSRFDAEHLERSAESLAAGLALCRRVRSRLAAAASESEARRQAVFLLDIKERQFEKALALSLSLDLASYVEPDHAPGSPFPGFRFAVETMKFVAPGQTFHVSATLANRGSGPLAGLAAEIAAPEGWTARAIPPAAEAELAPGSSARWLFEVTAPASPKFTAARLRRKSLEESLAEFDDPRDILEPRSVFPLRARVRFSAGGTPAVIERTVATRRIDPLRGEQARDLGVAPPVSVSVSPAISYLPLERPMKPAALEVAVSSNSTAAVSGAVRLELPPGWPPVPAQPFRLEREGASTRLSFELQPPRLDAGAYDVRAYADAAGGAWNSTVEPIEHADIAPTSFLRPAVAALHAVDVAIPPRLTVGYVEGAEDAIPAVLRQIGLDIHTLSADDLEKANLSRYSVIVTGPRAYDVRDDLKRFNGRLLDYVRAGGRLVVQYNSNTRAFNDGGYVPLPAKFPASNLRVTVEESPVEILHPEDPIWNAPNRITPRDFDGWVQERGLYFLGEWSADYTPLLSMHDPDEAPLQGGLVRARVGKGTYIFTGISWFRELPQGVPGALRIFLNLLSPDAK